LNTFTSFISYANQAAMQTYDLPHQTHTNTRTVTLGGEKRYKYVAEWTRPNIVGWVLQDAFFTAPRYIVREWQGRMGSGVV
jgi:hypothetical protein